MHYWQIGFLVLNIQIQLAVTELEVLVAGNYVFNYVLCLFLLFITSVHKNLVCGIH